MEDSNRKREVYRREDIDWELKRKEGLTNRQAAEEGYAPIRIKEDGTPEKVELHHHHQDKDGPLVEIWKSMHLEKERKAPRPSWLKQYPEEAARFKIEHKNYWKWRIEQIEKEKNFLGRTIKKYVG